MKPLHEYPISYPFGATSWPYSKTDPHHGDDYAAPKGTPINLQGVKLGEVGSTGYSTGNHCHIDKNKHLWASDGDVDPKDWQNITGVVIFASYAGTAGNTVIIEADNGYFYRFLHMSKITARVGQKVEGNVKITKDERDIVRILHSEIGGWNLHKTHKGDYDKRFMDAWQGKDLEKLIRTQWKYGSNFRSRREKALNYYQKKRPQLNKEVSDLRKENAALKAKVGAADELNAFGKALSALLVKLGFKKEK